MRMKRYWRLTTSSLKPKGAKTSTRTYNYFIAIVTTRKLLKTDNDKWKTRGQNLRLINQLRKVVNRKLSREVLEKLVFVDEERCDGKLSRTVL